MPQKKIEVQPEPPQVSLHQLPPVAGAFQINDDDFLDERLTLKIAEEAGSRPVHCSPDTASIIMGPGCEMVDSAARASVIRHVYCRYQRLQDEVLLGEFNAPDSLTGRGIVICAGGPRFFTCAWVLIHMLRSVLKSALPIQVWYRGVGEMDARMLELLRALDGVEPVDATRIPGYDRIRGKHGWTLKPFAILNSLFQEVPSFESGQVLIDKSRCWKPLLMTMHLNEHSDFYYRFLYGDKDTFHFGWRMAERDFAMPARSPVCVTAEPDPLRLETGPVLLQAGFDGRVIFQHRYWPKWVVFGTNARFPGFRYEEECLEFVRELENFGTAGWVRSNCGHRRAACRTELEHGGSAMS